MNAQKKKTGKKKVIRVGNRTIQIIKNTGGSERNTRIHETEIEKHLNT